MSIKEGSLAPDFTLPTDTGETINLSSLRGKNIVLYFYPKDDTPGCTQEAKDFNEIEPELHKMDSIILGLSKDSPKSHDKFKCKYGLSFNLVSDETQKTIEEYGSWVEKSMYGKKYMGIDRSTFLIDKAGTIRKIWRKVSVTGHATEVLKEVKKLASS